MGTTRNFFVESLRMRFELKITGSSYEVVATFPDQWQERDERLPRVLDLLKILEGLGIQEVRVDALVAGGATEAMLAGLLGSGFGWIVDAMPKQTFKAGGNVQRSSAS